MPTIINGEMFLTFQETSARLGVSRQTIDAWVKAGRLKKTRQGVMRSVFFKESEIDAILRMRQQDDSESQNK